MKQLCILFTLLVSNIVAADEFDTLIAASTVPPGVVIEIISDDDDLLKELLPELKINIEKLRDKFPKLPIAIVSHGSEQFAMTKINAADDQKTHSLVETLVKQEDIDFHICGTHASWYGVMPEDFPDYVDVTHAGPVQINDYEALGYELIVLP